MFGQGYALLPSATSPETNLCKAYQDDCYLFHGCYMLFLSHFNVRNEVDIRTAIYSASR